MAISPLLLSCLVNVTDCNFPTECNILTGMLVPWQKFKWRCSFRKFELSVIEISKEVEECDDKNSGRIILFAELTFAKLFYVTILIFLISER